MTINNSLREVEEAMRFGPQELKRAKHSKCTTGKCPVLSEKWMWHDLHKQVFCTTSVQTGST